MGILQGIFERHQRLKERIHNFRLPLSRRGQIIMNFVYFCIPVVGGHYTIQWAQRRAQVNLRDAGVLPEPGEPEGKSRTERQNAFIKQRLEEIKAEAKDEKQEHRR